MIDEQIFKTYNHQNIAEKHAVHNLTHAFCHLIYSLYFIKKKAF